MGRGHEMRLGGREGTSLRSLRNDRKEPASKLLRAKYPDGSSSSPKLPSTQALVQDYLKGNQVQNSEAPAFIIKAFGARTEIAVGISTAPSLRAMVPTGFLYLARGRGLNPCLLGNLAPTPPPLLKCP